MATLDKLPTRYDVLIEKIFFDNYGLGNERVFFSRTDIEDAARDLNILLPKNLGDIIYSFKYRVELPGAVGRTAKDGREWVIKNIGRAKYCFEQVVNARVIPDYQLVSIKIPDSTPGIVAKYALDDEQALLTKMRYNRLLDIFTGVACYSLQNHLRTTVPGIGQVETDEIYVGIDKAGCQYVFPLQAKGGTDKIGVVQIEQDMMLCRHKYPDLICRAVAAQFMSSGEIAMFEFVEQDGVIKKLCERHYFLMPNQGAKFNDLI